MPLLALRLRPQLWCMLLQGCCGSPERMFLQFLEVTINSFFFFGDCNFCFVNWSSFSSSAFSFEICCNVESSFFHFSILSLRVVFKCVTSSLRLRFFNFIVDNVSWILDNILLIRLDSSRARCCHGKEGESIVLLESATFGRFASFVSSPSTDPLAPRLFFYRFSLFTVGCL